MTPNEINRQIAELCGWEFVPSRDNYAGIALPEKWIDQEGNDCDECPNYHDSLDACAEFERTLSSAIPADINSAAEISLYKDLLEHLCGNGGAIIAAAPYRCHAFLRLRNQLIS